MTRSVRYQPILHTLYYTLHTEHAYCLSYCFLNNVVITTVIEMVEMVEILGGRLGKCSVERIRYVINNTPGHCEIWRHFTRTLYFHSPAARDNTVTTCEISHADPCNKSYIYSCRQTKNVIERIRDLIYLKFVATDFFQKISSPPCW